METETYKGYTIAIEHDTDAESPAEWGSYTIVTFHTGNITDVTNIEKYAFDSGKLKPWVGAKMRAGKMFAISYSSHGPMSNYGAMYGSANLDDIDGFIIFTDEYAKNFSAYEDRYKMAEQDMETYTQWANGEVYGYDITGIKGYEFEDGSCWGFYGYEDVIDEAKRAIDYHISIDRPNFHTVTAHEVHK